MWWIHLFQLGRICILFTFFMVYCFNPKLMSETPYSMTTCWINWSTDGYLFTSTKCLVLWWNNFLEKHVAKISHKFATVLLHRRVKPSCESLIYLLKPINIFEENQGDNWLNLYISRLLRCEVVSSWIMDYSRVWIRFRVRVLCKALPKITNCLD